jgi:hypothetical protein
MVTVALPAVPMVYEPLVESVRMTVSGNSDSASSMGVTGKVVLLDPFPIVTAPESAM